MTKENIMKLIIRFDLTDLGLIQPSLPEVTVQAPCRMTSFHHKVEVNVQHNLQPLGATNSKLDLKFEYAIIQTEKWFHSRLIAELQQKSKLLQKQMENIQILVGYVLASLNQRGIPTDKNSLEDYQRWSSGKHYDS